MHPTERRASLGCMALKHPVLLAPTLAECSNAFTMDVLSADIEGDCSSVSDITPSLDADTVRAMECTWVNTAGKLGIGMSVTCSNAAFLG